VYQPIERQYVAWLKVVTHGLPVAVLRNCSMRATIC
jgi:hypothetical protein